MKLITLISISCFTMITVWTLYTWMDRWTSITVDTREGFTPDVAKLIAATNGSPSKQDVILAHQTLLRYIESDFSKGTFVVNDLRDRFFPPNTPLKDGFDPATLLKSGPLVIPSV